MTAPLTNARWEYWSRRVGEDFLDWLELPTGLKCADVGCGNGAFTELLVERCRPIEVQGIDPSPQQIEFARKRHTAKIAEFRQGDAMALPFPDNRFDAAIMALVIFFVPEPAQGVAEMARVVSPGGTVAAYAWDMLGGGFPSFRYFRKCARSEKRPSGRRASKHRAWILLRKLWSEAGLEALEIRKIIVQRTFADFDDFWTSSTAAGSVRATVAALARSEAETVKTRLRATLPADADGRITHTAFANAIKGRVRK